MSQGCLGRAGWRSNVCWPAFGVRRTVFYYHKNERKCRTAAPIPARQSCIFRKYSSPVPRISLPVIRPASVSAVLIVLILVLVVELLSPVALPQIRLRVLISHRLRILRTSGLLPLSLLRLPSCIFPLGSGSLFRLSSLVLLSAEMLSAAHECEHEKPQVENDKEHENNRKCVQALP